MTQNEPGGIVALATEAQQTLVQAQRQIQFADVHVIGRLPVGNMKELRGGTQLLAFDHDIAGIRARVTAADREFFYSIKKEGDSPIFQAQEVSAPTSALIRPVRPLL